MKLTPSQAKSLNLTLDQVASLCDCDEWWCESPHTIADLNRENGVTVLNPETCPTCSEKITCFMGTEQKPYCITCVGTVTTNPNCPKCLVSKDVCVYEYDGKPEAWCNTCSINFDVETKRIIPIEFNEEDKDTTEAPKEPVKHLMTFDGQLYTCSGCTFETSFISECNIHEAGPQVEEELHFVKNTNPGTNCKTYECIYCQAKFANWELGYAHETKAGRAANIKNYSPSTTTTTTYKHCTHKPQHVLKGEDWGVWAGRKYDCEDYVGDFNIVLNLSGSKLSNVERHDIPIKELKKWEGSAKFREIMLDWPDRGTVSLPKAFWSDLVNFLKTKKYKMLVFCIGGHGRTGTAIASLLVTAFGWEPKAATEWIWDHYCEQAIETDKQINYVYNLVGQKFVPHTETKEDVKEINAPKAYNCQMTLDT